MFQDLLQDHLKLLFNLKILINKINEIWEHLLNR